MASRLGRKRREYMSARLVQRLLPTSRQTSSCERRGKSMPCARCLSSARCIFYYPHPLLISAFYVAQLAVLLVLNVSVSRGITQPEAFCAGTTAAYRKGNGSNSALAPSNTLHLLDSPCIARHALGVARRLRRVPWLRHLRQRQLGHTYWLFLGL